MSSNGLEKEINDNPMPPSIPEEGLESAEKVLNLQIDADDIRRCIGCPIVEECIEKWEVEPDALSSAAYLRYAIEIQRVCQGPKEETSLFTRKSIAVCNSRLLVSLPKRMRKSL